MGERSEDRGASAEARRKARCALILVDLDVSDGCDDAIRDALARWAQEARFAVVSSAPGVSAGDARGVIVASSLDEVVSALSMVTK